MNRSRTLGLPRTTWLSPEEPRTSEYARSADERVTEYFKEHAGAVTRVLASRFKTRPSEDAEEAVRDAFLRLHAEIKAGTTIERPDAWVFTTAKRLMLDRIRKDKSEETVLTGYARFVGELDESPTGEEMLLERDRTNAFERALSELTDLQRQCLRLRGDGLKLREIGALVGLDLRRVAEQIAKAIAHLEKQVRG
jgi:RNA polymerase sigma factor (sigma-70 family)